MLRVGKNEPLGVCAPSGHEQILGADAARGDEQVLGLCAPSGACICFNFWGTGMTINVILLILLLHPPRSNMHDRKRPFTEKKEIYRDRARLPYTEIVQKCWVIKGETSVLRIRSYTTAVYGRARLSQLFSLMNSKYFNLFYFILFILGHLDGLNEETVSIFILFYFRSSWYINLNRGTVSILIYFVLFYLF